MYSAGPYKLPPGLTGAVQAVVFDFVNSKIVLTNAFTVKT